ncbi:MAG TPA: cytochrome c1 [Alphaproteobacteria bacterium]|nr:cytochrome c1 [Alphaproteobacteria bacterium]
MPRKIFIAVCAVILLMAVAPIAVTGFTGFLNLFRAHATEKPVLLVGADTPHGPPGGWPEQGIFGTYNMAAVQRGYQVYKEVCSNCHSMKLLSYRDLTQLGFDKADVKAIAAGYKVPTLNDQGQPAERAALPSDPFVSPFPNEKAARASFNGALPPDLSLIIKAREGHEDYVYSILTGFGRPVPADEKPVPNKFYNPWFSGHWISMPPPLSDNSVTFADGTKATVAQEAKDVVQFLAWASEPHLAERHEIGIKVVLFLIAFAAVMYGIKKRIWGRLKRRDRA